MTVFLGVEGGAIKLKLRVVGIRRLIDDHQLGVTLLRHEFQILV
jgi:hypothetical protein